MVSSISDQDGVCEADHNACVAHNEAPHDELHYFAVVMVLGQWIQCLGHEEWVCTKSKLGG